MNRRGFMQAILASATAPYVVTTAGVLMPVRKIVVPDYLTDPARWHIAADNGNFIFVAPDGHLYINGERMSRGSTINDAIKRLS